MVIELLGSVTGLRLSKLTENGLMWSVEKNHHDPCQKCHDSQAIEPNGYTGPQRFK